MEYLIIAAQVVKNEIWAFKLENNPMITYDDLLYEINMKQNKYYIELNGIKHYFRLSDDNKKFEIPSIELVKQIPTF